MLNAHARAAASGDDRARSVGAADDAVGAARAAGLRYVNDDEPGFTRRRHGRGFAYRDSDARRVRDTQTLARIRALAIPPAWRDVWICPDGQGHIQATGRDARGRKQYRYHPLWRAVRDSAKYERTIAFAEALPRLQRRVRRDLARKGLPREKVVAAVVRLLEMTLLRVGNDEYARANRSYGLTTLRDQHAYVRGSRFTLAFSRQGRPTARSRPARPARGADRRARSCPANGCSSTSTPTDGARASPPTTSTITCAGQWAATSRPRTSARGRAPCWPPRRCAPSSWTPPSGRPNAALCSPWRMSPAAWATRLAVCRRCYIHPAVIDAHLDGSLRTVLADRAARELAVARRLRADERRLLHLLRNRLRAGRQASSSAAA